MSVTVSSDAARPVADRAFFKLLMRAFAGAVLFGLPLLMTAEMWTLGFTMQPERLALMLVLTVPLLTGLAYYGGFRHNIGLGDSLVDGLVSFAVGVVASIVVLCAFGVLDSQSSVQQVVGVVALQSVSAGMGAALASSQLGLDENDDGADDGGSGGEAPERGESYGGELFLMVAGALFFAFNLTPTEEIILIAQEQGHVVYAIGLMLASLGLLHAFVYALGFRGQHEAAHERARLPTFVSLTLPGYALVLLTSLLVLWLFGRLDGLEPSQALHMTTVLGLPGALGAATARLIL